MLFELTTGPVAYAIATFASDLDGSSTADFFTDCVFYVPGNLRVIGATKDPEVIPLPAGILLLGSGLAGLGLLGVRQAT